MSSKNKKNISLKVESSNEPTPIILDDCLISNEFGKIINSNTLVKEEGIKKERLNPYQIHIKNLTDEKLYDVDIFNYKHEKQRKVEYSCPNGVPYERFLIFLSSNLLSDEKVNLFTFSAFCDYGKFKIKQLNCCLHTIYQKSNGDFSSVPTSLGNYFSPYQHQSDILDIPMTDNNKIVLNNELQLRLSYLMPETEVSITIFPCKIIK